MEVKLAPASLISIPSWVVEVITSDVVSQLWGLEGCMNRISLISPELFSTEWTCFFFFFYVRRSERCSTQFIPNPSFDAVPSPMLFSLGKLHLSTFSALFPIVLLLS